jgi:hypothetical protein
MVERGPAGPGVEPVDLEPSPPSGARFNARVLIAGISVVAILAVGVVVYTARDHHVATPAARHRRTAERNHDAPIPQRVVRVVPGPQRPAAIRLNPAALTHVMRAVQATAATGSFTVSFHSSTAAPATPPPAPCSNLRVVVPSSSDAISYPAPPKGHVGPSCAAPVSNNTTVDGKGIVDVSPFAMVTVSRVSGLGAITVRVDGTNVWEYGGADYGTTSPNAGGGPGAPLSGFANLVEGTLGPRAGAGAMQGLSSPTGYIAIEAQMVIGAQPDGTGVVDGVPVTFYVMETDATPLQPTDLTPEEATTISDANAVMKAQGFTGSTITLAVDAQDLIRESKTISHFADGGSTTGDNTFDGFGCAGRVLMPGEHPATPKLPGPCVGQNTKAP